MQWNLHLRFLYWTNFEWQIGIFYIMLLNKNYLIKITYFTFLLRINFRQLTVFQSNRSYLTINKFCQVSFSQFCFFLYPREHFIPRVTFMLYLLWIEYITIQLICDNWLLYNEIYCIRIWDKLFFLISFFRRFFSYTINENVFHVFSAISFN